MFFRELVEGDHPVPVAQERVSGRSVAFLPAPSQEQVPLFFSLRSAFRISQVLESLPGLRLDLLLTIL